MGNRRREVSQSSFSKKDWKTEKREQCDEEREREREEEMLKARERENRRNVYEKHLEKSTTMNVRRKDKERQ